MTEAVGYWLLLKVFASGCTALTGVEAVSSTPEEFTAQIKTDVARLGKVIKDAGIKAD